MSQSHALFVWAICFSAVVATAPFDRATTKTDQLHFREIFGDSYKNVIFSPNPDTTIFRNPGIKVDTSISLKSKPHKLTKLAITTILNERRNLYGYFVNEDMCDQSSASSKGWVVLAGQTWNPGHSCNPSSGKWGKWIRAPDVRVRWIKDSEQRQCIAPTDPGTKLAVKDFCKIFGDSYKNVKFIPNEVNEPTVFLNPGSEYGIARISLKPEPHRVTKLAVITARKEHRTLYGYFVNEENMGVQFSSLNGWTHVKDGWVILAHQNWIGRGLFTCCCCGSGKWGKWEIDPSLRLSTGPD